MRQQIGATEWTILRASLRPLLEADHYWVRRSFKIDVTQEEKRQVGKHSIPRPEIDLLAFNFSKNEVIAFEVKSFLNSPGVRLEDLQREHEVQEGRYKLFTSRGYREVVLTRLKKDLISHGMADANTKVTLGLAAGKVYQKKSEPPLTQSKLMRVHLEKMALSSGRQKTFGFVSRRLRIEPTRMTPSLSRLRFSSLSLPGERSPREVPKTVYAASQRV